MLTKEQFIKSAQGEFQNDNTNLWVNVEDVQANVTYDHPETEPFENSEKFDNMPFEEAMTDDIFEELYQSYVEQKKEEEN